MIGLFVAIQQPQKVDITLTELFDPTAGKRSVHVSVDENFHHDILGYSALPFALDSIFPGEIYLIYHIIQQSYLLRVFYVDIVIHIDPHLTISHFCDMILSLV